MGRSVRVRKDYIEKVKLAVQRQGFPRQKDLAETLGFSLATVSNFLNGKPVDWLNFSEISEKLGFDWQDIQDISNQEISLNTNGDGNGSGVITPDEDDNFIYIDRPPIEEICDKTLSQPGGLLRIKAPGWMGKTSLMARILGKMAHQGYRTVLVDMHYAETDNFSNLEKFLKWFCVSVSQSLHMDNRIADYWDDQFSTPKMNCTAYFEEYLLAKSSAPLILCLDTVERIFPHEKVAGEFLGLLRAWHEQAKTRPLWKQLRLVIAHSTEVYVPLRVNESPFNVGVPIELPEFTPEQVLLLAKQYGLERDLQQIQPLIDKVGGHPYLVGEAFKNLQLNPTITLEQLLQTSVTDRGIYGNLLRHYWRLIEQDSELAAVLKTIVKSPSPVRVSPTQAHNLYRMGLVKSVGNEVIIGCEVYREYFSDRFDFLDQ
ncbi:AAA-like domain-containing protein [Calothrix sp. 336/3]|uniref:AAA-like domain-containing protein n=1 Tax=Calothrix sp. 336/3 TaxID=1337936 RepID=UPI0004E29F28|nr:AAA-like domain-containing protein [Calothrix sp. 336/3]AKG19966.1 molecular chaperone Tir [Calothrix sp. 336/3]